MIRCPGKPGVPCGETKLAAARRSAARVLVVCAVCGRFRWVSAERWAAHCEDVQVGAVRRTLRDGRALASGEGGA